MATAKKSILKKPSYPATSSSRGESKEARDREIALYHANLIQQRKDVEYEILLSTETLIDFPLAAAPYDASNPSPSDAQAFKKLLGPFQPSDYDALIVERNINERCGYALCPKPRVKDSAGGKYRILGMNGKAKDFRVVEKEVLERWCSEECAKRALYVKVQLGERPAWERETLQNNIDLLDEPQSEEGAVLDKMEKLHLGGDEEEVYKKGAADLALERGDKGLHARDGLVGVSIKEKQIERPVEAPSLEAAELSGQLDNMHLTLEGHTPSFGKDTELSKDEEDQDTDWNL